MKKLSIILLVLIMAGGMAFGADLAITGDVTFSTSFDLDTMAGGFDGVADTLEYEASIVLLSGGSAAVSGEGDVYVVLEVSVDDLVLDFTETTADIFPVAGEAISIDTFKIVAGDISVNLLGNSEAGNFADYFDYFDNTTPGLGDPDDDADIDIAFIDLAGENGGVDVSYGDDITVGVDFWYDGDVAAATPDPTTTFLLWGAYSTTALVDGLTVSVAAGIDNVVPAVAPATTPTGGADVSAQLAYASDDYSVTVGVDTADNFALYEVEADIDAVIDIVTVDANVYYDGTDVYVADQNTIALGDLSIGLDFYYNDLASGDYIAADVATDIDALSVAVSAGFDYDAAAMNADVLLELGYAVSDATQVDARVGYDMATSFNVGATLTQTIEAGSIVAMFDYQADETIDASIEFSSSSLIDGAALSIGWAAEDVVADLGDITASVTVEL